MKIYSITVPFKIKVNCLDYSLGIDKAKTTSKEKSIEIDLNIRSVSSEEECIQKFKYALQQLIEDEINTGLTRNSDDF